MRAMHRHLLKFSAGSRCWLVVFWGRLTGMATNAVVQVLVARELGAGGHATQLTCNMSHASCGRGTRLCGRARAKRFAVFHPPPAAPPVAAVRD